LTEATAAGDGARVGALLDHWTLITGLLHHHHEGEDDLLWPLLADRSAAPELIASMKDQHSAMVTTLDQAEVVVSGWAEPGPSGGGQAGTDLAPLLRLAEEITEHFDAEEGEVLPLCQDLLNQEEWEALGTRGRASVPPEQLPVVACLFLEDADADAVTAFLAPMPPEVRALATGPWQEAYAGYVRTLRGG